MPVQINAVFDFLYNYSVRYCSAYLKRLILSVAIHHGAGGSAPTIFNAHLAFQWKELPSNMGVV